MIPIDEGNYECQRCEYFYNAYGCIPTYNDEAPPCGRKRKELIMPNDKFMKAAAHIVAQYVLKHLDKSDETPHFEVYVVWLSKVLQNNKALLATTLPDGMYYEVTYDGDKKAFYLDAYKKFENVRISEEMTND